MTVLPTTYKILSNILVSRSSPQVDEIFGEYRCGFRRNRSNTDQIFCDRWEYGGTVHQVFTDLQKTYDSVT